MEKQIEIRRAEEKDIKKVMDLLSQVLEIHAKIRPDVFVSGTTKYTDAELLQMFEDDQNPVYVAVDEKDQVVGYAFCYEVTLNVWEGNDSAKAFYEKMGLKPKETQMEYIIKDQGDRCGG